MISVRLPPSITMAILPFFSCLLLALCISSLSANVVFISIDCGSSVTYKDENGITWTGDDNYVKTGESRSVQSSSSYNHVMDTLRVFTSGIKNCYNIDSVRPGRVLLRLSFYYGNYDGKSSPPRFDFMFDGYYCGSVSNSGPKPNVYEAIYVTNKNAISVCVAQIEEGQFPYISAVEVRSLEPYMYTSFDDRYPVATRRRVAYGTNATISLPDDPYDRQWTRDRFTNGTILRNPDGLMMSSGSGNGVMVTDNKPPAAVLKTAVSAVTLNSSLPLFMSLPSSYNISVHIYMYFSEVTRLRRNQIRSFYVLKDNHRFSPPISPPYGNYTQISITNIAVSSNTSFSLVATQDSTLPPLINAMEVFFIGSSPLLNATHDKDVEGLASLQEAFSSLQDWSGDPCLPTFYKWDWVVCNDDSTPRVTTLLLGGYGLSGLLPDLSSMEALHTINLSNNSLRGNIPDFLGTLPNLKILNLENNQLNGTIPASLSTKKGLILRVNGNPQLCTSNTTCPIPVGGPPANSSVRKRKNILETLFATIVSSIIVLQIYN